jgi:hypothetical protein
MYTGLDVGVVDDDVIIAISAALFVKETQGMQELVNGCTWKPTVEAAAI